MLVWWLSLALLQVVRGSSIKADTKCGMYCKMLSELLFTELDELGWRESCPGCKAPVLCCWNTETQTLHLVSLVEETAK